MAKRINKLLSKILIINILLLIVFFKQAYANKENSLIDDSNSFDKNIQFSVIIPLAPKETAWKNLLNDLTQLPDNTEILFVISNKTEIPDKTISIPNKKIYWIKAKPGRATQMNAGAKAAKGKYLWFLHADSKFESRTIPSLLHAVKIYPNSLLFFKLIFLNDATALMQLNTWGAYFRSYLLKVPFGDQGFCINKNLFKKLGMYPEGLSYGEDHIFVWKARQQNIPIEPTGGTLYTSARKYKIHGWLKTTFITQYLWIKQAIPELIKLYKIRFHFLFSK